MRIATRLTGIEKEGKTIRIFTDAVEIRLLFLTDDILRIRAGFDGDFEEASYILTMTAWEDRLDGFLGNERKRIEAADCRLVDSAGEVNRLAPQFTGLLSYPQGVSAEGLTLVMGERLTVAVYHDPFMLKIYDSDGTLLHEDIPYMGYRADENGRRMHTQVQESEDHYYGFGERTGNIDKRGDFLRNAPGDTMGYDPEKTDPLYKHIPFYIRLNDRTKKASGYYYNNTYECDFDMGRSHSNYVKHHSTYRTDGGDIDLFFIAGPDVKDVIRRYTDLTGKSALLPKAALGYLGSSMYYAEQPVNADRAIEHFIDTADKEGFPIDGFQLSSGYCNVETSEGLKRCTFTWNHDRFPDPRAFFSAMKKRGITVSPNVKPAMLLSHPLHDEMAEKGLFIRNAKEDKPAVGLWWGGLGNYVDFTDENARNVWKDCLKKSLIEQGTVSVWNDNCEYDGLVDQGAKVSYEGRGATAGALKSVMANIMNRMTIEAVHEAVPDERPFAVTRSGCAGIQRYAQTWAGDNRTCWEALKYNIATILGMGLSGVANMGADIGGFYGPAPEEELFVRWVQNGIFQPRFSIHSTNTDNTVTEPWMYSGSKERIRRAIAFRYTLFPYLYSLMYRAHETGLPMMEPVFLAYPDDPAVYGEGIDFLEGDGLFVANVVEPGVKTRRIYFPAGHTFYDFYTREGYTGGRAYDIPVTLDSVPLFLTEGAIVPLSGNHMTNVSTQAVTDLSLVLVPAGSSSFVYYDDDGHSMDYEKDGFRRTEITMTDRTADNCGCEDSAAAAGAAASDGSVHADSAAELSGPANTVTVSFRSTGAYPSTVETMHLDMVHREGAPYFVKLGDRMLPHFLNRSEYEAAPEGWYYSMSKKSVEISYPNPKADYDVFVSFEPVDLIGM
ncbi:MAG: TIM-barrel domain-containing protein [Lachnospiraceae bacterium]|nr:TIM-barrel domain-containing protein [Lachnospiraceae bacterium]